MPLSPYRPIVSRSAALSAATAFVAVGLSVGGCDQPADVAVRQDLATAYAYRSGGDTQRRYAQIAAKAAADSGASDFPATTAAASQELLGDVNAESAADVLGGTAPDAAGGLVDTAGRALYLIGQADLLANDLALGKTFIDGQLASDPQPTLAMIAAETANVRDAQQGWKPTPAAQDVLASLAQTQARIDELNGRVEQLTAQNADLDRQRGDKLGQASSLDEQSQRQGGTQGVQTYRKVSDLRNEASGIVAQQTKLAGELLVARQDLAEEQALKASLEDALAALQKQQSTLETSWQQVQGQIAQLRQGNDATYGGGSGGGGGSTASVEAIGQQLADAVRQFEDQKREAVRLLDEAGAAYTKAGQQAGRAVSAAGNQSDPALSKATRETFDPKRISLKQALAKRQLGRVHAASASVYGAMLGLQETLRAADRELPAALSVDPAAQYQAAVTAAADAYDNANADLTGVVESATGDLQSAAITQKAVLLSGMLGLDSLIGQTGAQVQSSLPTRDELQSQVRQVIDAANTSNATLPPTAAFSSANAPAAEAPPAGGETPPQAEVEPGEAMNPDEAGPPAADAPQ